MAAPGKPAGKRQMPAFGEIRSIKKPSPLIQDTARRKYISTEEALKLQHNLEQEKSGGRMPTFDEIQIGKTGLAAAGMSKNPKIAVWGFVGPDGGERFAFYERMIGTKLFDAKKINGVVEWHFKKPLLKKIFIEHHMNGRIHLPKEIEPVVFRMSIARAFASIELPGGNKTARVRSVIGQLKKMGSEGRIGLDGKIEIVFTQTDIASIDGALGRNGREFRENFRCFLQDEVEKTKDYLKKKCERIIKSEQERAVARSRKSGSVEIRDQ